MAAFKSSKSYAKSWIPRVDKGLKDPFLPDKPEILLKQMKNQALKSIVIGHNTEEGLEKLGPYLKDPRLFANFTTSMPEMIFGPDQSKRALEMSIIKALKR